MKLLLGLVVLALAGCTTEKTDVTDITHGVAAINQWCHEIGGVMVTKHVWLINGENKFELICTNVPQAQPPQGG